MPLQGEYQPSTEKWVRDQVETIESSGGADGMSMNGMPIVLVTMHGAKSGKLRKVPVMRVEHDGDYAVVASKGGAPENPGWYNNLVADPQVELRDGTQVWDMTAREISGDERATWWERAVKAYPPYDDYQEKTDREIPVFVVSTG